MDRERWRYGGMEGDWPRNGRGQPVSSSPSSWGKSRLEARWHITRALHGGFPAAMQLDGAGLFGMIECLGLPVRGALSMFMSGADYVWLISYAIVVLGLSAFGIHRYVMVYLFLKNSRNKPVPAGQFTDLPLVTIQLPVFNEQHVVARLVDAPQMRMRLQDGRAQPMDRTQSSC